MTPKTVKYYDWFKDLQPIILANLNEILASRGIDPLENLHGGSIKDGKWVGSLESDDYRNFWHVYMNLWGDHVRNDSYDEVYYAESDDDEVWEWYYEQAEKKSDVKRSGYEHSDPKWTRNLVDAVRKMCRDHSLYDGVLIYWSW